MIAYAKMLCDGDGGKIDTEKASEYYKEVLDEMDCSIC